MKNAFSLSEITHTPRHTPTQICVNELDIFKDLTLRSPLESTAIQPVIF